MEDVTHIGNLERLWALQLFFIELTWNIFMFWVQFYAFCCHLLIIYIVFPKTSVYFSLCCMPYCWILQPIFLQSSMAVWSWLSKHLFIEVAMIKTKTKRKHAARCLENTLFFIFSLHAKIRIYSRFRMCITFAVISKFFVGSQKFLKKNRI